ncbi:hypothetical protein [Paludibaculum fermentans]|uniref:PEP-CTERM protein-sorting domain-containing protein n=1 Tax=Paludibaculum fermentans TaxID=1473598 RepID=A0A7S7SLC8_PALFE|nr:hypothetical protein [Paludibaculum fermentans]QOY89244.1 hypothetical protein IRI77_04620 [Paludibaculum fermentans]
MVANLLRCGVFILLAMAFTPVATAGGPLDPAPGPWSLAREQGCANGNIADCYLWVLDPPYIQSITVDLLYDPTKMTIIDTGFLCDFAKPGTGSCPTTLPGTTGDGTSTILGDPIDGSFVSLVMGPGSLSLTYTPPPNAVQPGPDRNFFGIMFTSPYQNVRFEMTPGVYDFFQASTSCTVADPLGTCGSDSPIYGATFLTPEPQSWVLTSAGLLLLLGLTLRRRGLPAR